MIKVPLFRIRQRHAISTMIGGVIVLLLLLTAISLVVFVSQQFYQYQQIVNSITQYRNQQQFTERLIVNSPGFVPPYPPPTNWSCGASACNMYNMSLSNLGSVGIQIVGIYINSTGSAGTGCNPDLCTLQAASSATSYAFSSANAYINPGELNHALLLWLPSGVVLPNPSYSFPQNTVTLVTARGNVFSFQWPFQSTTFGQTQSAFSSGNIRVAYQGTYDSKNEAGPRAAGSGGSSGAAYCHSESVQSYPASPGYAEELTGISGVTNNILWFLNPWITQTIMNSANNPNNPGTPGSTRVYIYVDVVNTGSAQYSVSSATIDLTWSGSNHLDGWLFGVFYNGKFYSTSPQIPPGASYYAIFEITIFSIQNPPSSGQSAMLWGSASFTDQAEDQTYFGGTILLSGLWIRASC